MTVAMTEDEAEAEAARRNARDGEGEWVAVTPEPGRWEVQASELRRPQRDREAQDVAERHSGRRVLATVAAALWVLGLWLFAVDGRPVLGGVVVLVAGLLLVLAASGGLVRLARGAVDWLTYQR